MTLASLNFKIIYIFTWQEIGRELKQWDRSGVNAFFLPSGGLWGKPAPSATRALTSMKAFVGGWPVTQAGIVPSHHTKTNSGPPTAKKTGGRGLGAASGS